MGRRWHFFFAWVFFVNGALYVAYSTCHPPSQPRSAADPGRLALDRPIDSGSSALASPHGRGGATLQRAAKADISARDVRSTAAHHADGFRVCRHGLILLWPGWVGFFGGRQAMRTLHFILAWAIVLFVLVHVFEVIISGFWNNLRSMITGRYAVRTDPGQMPSSSSRGSFLKAALGGACAALLTGCDALSNTQWFPKILGDRRAPEPKCSALDHVSKIDGTGVHRSRPVTRVSQQRNGLSG